MKSIVAYVRNLLGWCDEDDPAIKSSFKRDRTDDDLFCDEAPALKRVKQLKRSSFPSPVSSNDIWDREESKNVRYVPVQVEKVHPSTSTPIEMSRSNNRTKARMVKLVDLSENVPLTPTRNHPKPRNNVPKRPILHEVVDDDDDEVTWVASKPVKPKKPPNLYIDLNDEESDQDQEEQENDVIYVKQVSGPTKPYKFYTAQNDQQDSVENDGPYYRLSRNLNDRKSTLSPKSYTRFKAPAGITKTSKKTPLPRFLQPQKPPTSASRSRLLNMNGSNIRSTLSEVFNLDEKKNYQELIRRVAETTKPMTFGKPLDIINIADDSASLRNTQRSQKKSLNEIKLVEKGLKAERESEASREYDPITVASINSSDSEVEVVPSESSSSSVRIDPINTLKESFRDRAVTSTDWVAKLESKYKKRHQDTQAKLKEARRESDIISKVNYEQNIAYVEHKLKYELSIPECLIEEAQPAVELPELTPEQEKLINRAIGPGPAGQLIVEKFNLRIHRRDLQTLAGLNWLNDEVINFYMNLLMQRSQERKDLPKVYATNTFFYPKLMQSGQAGLRRWTRKVDIFAHDLMVAPVHLGVHWCMSMVDFRSKKIQYLDSMGGRNQGCLEALMQYLHDEHQDKKGAPFDDKGWKLETLSKDIPQQMNGSDCGMFSCTFAEFAARNAPYTFTQSHMPYLRRKAALEIITGKLLL